MNPSAMANCDRTGESSALWLNNQEVRALTTERLLMWPLLVLLAIILPTAWFASEFQDKRWLRIVFGVAALSMSFLLAYGVGSLEHLNANSWYGGASKNLIDTNLDELEEGNTQQVIQELKRLQGQFHPTYEHRARYDELIEQYMSRLDHKAKPGV